MELLLVKVCRIGKRQANSMGKRGLPLSVGEASFECMSPSFLLVWRARELPSTYSLLLRRRHPLPHWEIFY